MRGQTWDNMLECMSEYKSANMMEHWLECMTGPMLECMSEYKSANRMEHWLDCMWENTMDHMLDLN